MTEPTFVLVLAAKNLFEAQIAAGLLEAAGIPDVSVPDVELRNVEFNAARQMMGLEACNVFVPAPYAEEARRVLAESHPAAGDPGDSGDSEEEDE